MKLAIYLAVLSALLSGATRTPSLDGVPAFFVETEPGVFAVDTPDLHARFGAGYEEISAGPKPLRIKFGGRAVPAGEEASGTANYLLGPDPVLWRTRLSGFRRIRYRNVAPGIDMTVAGHGGRIKSEFEVAPGADPASISLHFSTPITISADGSLRVVSERIQFREEPPVVYQGDRIIPSRFVLTAPDTAGFIVGPYDITRPLVIDPVLSYATYYGGTGLSAVTALTTDASGNVYAAGWTEALDANVATPYQASNRGGVDAFLVKLNPAGTQVLYATYMGGRGDDRPTGIAVDSSGNVYLAGSTTSTDFPLLNSSRTSLGGNRDAFVLKLSPSGNALAYSILLGGSSTDAASGVAIDGSGNALVAGDTTSSDFPVANAAQSTIGGKNDAFVAKISSSGSIVFSTFLGGSADEHVGGVATDAAGNVYVAGGTYSANFPTASPLQNIGAGGQDAFVAKLSGAGALQYSTYLGGSGADQANAIAVDSSGAAYVAGITSSSDFRLASAYQSAFAGVEDGFVCKLNPAGNALVYSTYLGGLSFDWASAIAVDSSGSAWLAGYTSSLNFPTISGVQASFNGGYDAFVSQLSPSGTTLSFSSLYGGSGSDSANALALVGVGGFVLGGQTNSLDLTVKSALHSSNTGGSVGWLAGFQATATQPPSPPSPPSAVSVSPASGSGMSVVLTATFSDSAGALAIQSAGILVNSTSSVTSACYVVWSRSQNQFVLWDDAAATSQSPGASGTVQNSQCSLSGSGSAAATSGNTLTVTVALTFLPAFQGAKNVYLQALDSTTATAFTSEGTWTVASASPQPTADSVTPSLGQGTGTTFTFTFSDSQNANNLTGMAMLFAPSLTFTNVCYIVFDRNAQTIALVWDGAGGSDVRPVGGAGSLQNSQCTVGSSVLSISGRSQIITVTVAFKTTFLGAKQVYMYATEPGANSGWVQRGTYTATAPSANGTPTATSVSPAQGTGQAQRFAFTLTENQGSSFLSGAGMLIAPSLNPSLSVDNACYVSYDRNVNTFSLSYDRASAGATPIVGGSQTSASNSQCILNGANSSVTSTATTLVVTIDLTFTSSFQGTKNVYLLAAEPLVNSGWVAVGSWTVGTASSGGNPSADSMLPLSGTGRTLSATASVSDPGGAANISGIGLLYTSGATTSLAGTCYVIVDPIHSTVGLAADDGVTIQTKALGSAVTLSNSQCAVGLASISTSGTSVGAQVNIDFTPSYAGLKVSYLDAVEASANTGWIAKAAWIVN